MDRASIAPADLARRARRNVHYRPVSAETLTAWLVTAGFADLGADGRLTATPRGREVGAALNPLRGA